MEVEILKKFFLCLIPLVFLWALSIWLLKLKTGHWSVKHNKFLEKIENLALNQHNSLHLVKIGESKVALIGVSPQQTNVLFVTDTNDLKPLHNTNVTEQLTNIPSSKSDEIFSTVKIFSKNEETNSKGAEN